MEDRVRFQLDECVAPAVADGLRRRGVDVVTAHEAGLLGEDDLRQIYSAIRSRRVFVTQDDDFLRLHQEGVRHAGIVYYQAGTRSIGQLIEFLELLHEVMEHEDMVGRVEFI